jgi:hypothetical protein
MSAEMKEHSLVHETRVTADSDSVQRVNFICMRRSGSIHPLQTGVFPHGGYGQEFIKFARRSTYNSRNFGKGGVAVLRISARS